MSNKDGGPAFPRQHFRLTNGTLEGGEKGMTLRDYFAAKAMYAIISGPTDVEPFTNDQLAQWSYQIADAMLKAREEQ